jgi:succinate-acetate transporter protein
MVMKNAENRISLNIANPNPLGYAALGTLLWVHGMIFSGIFPQAYGKIGEEVSMVFVICALLVAGIVAFLKNWTWDGTLFIY